MKSKIYQFLRLFFKLPRPNEIWGDKAQNKWSIFNIFLYLKMITAVALGWVGMLFGLVQTVLMLSIKFDVSGIIFIILTIIIGLAGLLIMGHALVVFGILKRENTLSQSQNDQVMQILKNTEELLKKLNENKNPQK